MAATTRAESTPTGICACGCGGATSVIDSSCARRGLVRGQYRRYVHGHHVVAGQPDSPWKDGMYTTVKGYRMHRKAGRFEHILIVERAIGKPLRASAEVHHVNHQRADNRPGNLVACDSHAYHMLLHRRQRALEACGDPNWIRCIYCGIYSPPDVMRLRTNGRKAPRYSHATCSRRPAEN